MPSTFTGGLRDSARRAWVGVKWPMPLWRARGYARLPIGAHEFEFHTIRPEHRVWALLSRRRNYEPHVIDFLERVLRPGDSFVDIGAHLGAFSLLASRHVGESGAVWAFEPDPNSRQLLMKNVDSNSASNVQIVPAAVSAREGAAMLAGGRGDAVSALSDNGTLEVSTVTLDGFCRERAVRPDVVKVDVEGGEVDVIEGGFETLSRCRTVVMEIHGAKLGRDRARRVLERLGDMGQMRELGNRHGTALDGNVNVALTPGAWT